MQAVPAHPVPAGPLGRALARLRARRAPGRRVERRPASSWRTPAARAWHDVFVSYHWLDDLGNPIDWDGLRDAAPAASQPGERASAEAARARADPAGPLPARLRPRARGPLLALRDRQRAARASRSRSASATHPAAVAHLPPEVEPAAGLGRARPRRARGGLRRRRRLDRRRPVARARRAYAPGRRPQPRLHRAARLPVSPPAARAELRRSRACRPGGRKRRSPGSTSRRIYDARISSSTAIRSSTRLNTHAPSASAITASAQQVDDVPRHVGSLP